MDLKISIKSLWNQLPVMYPLNLKENHYWVSESTAKNTLEAGCTVNKSDILTAFMTVGILGSREDAKTLHSCRPWQYFMFTTLTQNFPKIDLNILKRIWNSERFSSTWSKQLHRKKSWAMHTFQSALLTEMPWTSLTISFL